ncbi:uncharacterized protein CIMG_12357 [Coccidioides immitis RS]|uniref:Uncharacterized protein n=1 Tax=Coccidioides immitis (strain RS) TaxID=246410 RepID=A0A0D8JVP5_COCIM|nr:uncharacterized protein CIMG_12357 [Coccidioides immitis RS]KJF61382.1 hypothetical protein CIMG_12357 [Coccidioides immitis RS]
MEWGQHDEQLILHRLEGGLSLISMRLDVLSQGKDVLSFSIGRSAWLSVPIHDDEGEYGKENTAATQQQEWESRAGSHAILRARNDGRGQFHGSDWERMGCEDPRGGDGQEKLRLPTRTTQRNVKQGRERPLFPSSETPISAHPSFPGPMQPELSSSSSSSSGRELTWTELELNCGEVSKPGFARLFGGQAAIKAEAKAKEGERTNCGWDLAGSLRPTWLSD